MIGASIKKLGVIMLHCQGKWRSIQEHVYARQYEVVTLKMKIQWSPAASTVWELIQY